MNEYESVTLIDDGNPEDGYSFNAVTYRKRPTARDEARAALARMFDQVYYTAGNSAGREQAVADNATVLALLDEPVPSEDCECECGHPDELAHLKDAYAAVVSEYGKYRHDRQEQMTRIRDALHDALRGTRTGNMMTPPWVVASIEEAYAAWSWKAGQ